MRPGLESRVKQSSQGALNDNRNIAQTDSSVTPWNYELKIDVLKPGGGGVLRFWFPTKGVPLNARTPLSIPNLLQGLFLAEKFTHY